jgi:hypothetical protein
MRLLVLATDEHAFSVMLPPNLDEEEDEHVIDLYMDRLDQEFVAYYGYDAVEAGGQFTLEDI